MFSLVSKKVRTASPYTLSLLGILVSGLVLSENISMAIFSHIAWTGIAEAAGYAAIEQLIQIILAGASIATAIQTVTLLATTAGAAGALLILGKMIGRGYLKRLIARKGLQWVVAW